MLEEHPLASLIPPMRADDYAALRDDIAMNGLLQPIVLHDGKILDGRHRYRACLELGVEPRTSVYDGDAPLAYVVSANIARRHLTADQRAVLAVRLKAPLAEEARRRQHAAGQFGTLGGRGHRREDRAHASAPSDGAAAKTLVSNLIQGFFPPGTTGTRSTRTQQTLAALAGVSTGYIAYADYLQRHAPEEAERVLRGEVTVEKAYKQLRAEQQQRARAACASSFKARDYGGFENNGVFVADIATLALPPASVDMIFTDPPYHDEQLDLYRHLARLASICLKPGAYLMTYVGKAYLPQVMALLGERLEYVWLYGVFMPDNNQRFWTHHVFEAWRPILCYRQPGPTPTRDWQPDMIRATKDKTYHVWQQGLEPALKWIGAYTREGDLVVDPFVGGGTTVLACARLGRRYLGFDRDPQAVQTTCMRLRDDTEQTNVPTSREIPAAQAP
jgi:hypothetical protein